MALIFAFSMEQVRRKERAEKCSTDDLHKYFLKDGSENAAPMILKLFPECFESEMVGNVIHIKRRRTKEEAPRRELVAVNYKFGETSCEDVARFGRIAKKNNAKAVYVLSRSADRSAMSFAQTYTDIEFYFIPHKKLYKVLKKRGLLPKIEKPHRKRRSTFKDILRVAIGRTNFKRYLIIGVILSLSSFIVPFRWMSLYYLITAGAALILAFLCLTGLGENIRDGKNGVFDSLENSECPEEES